MKDEQPATHIIGFGALSEQVGNRTFACLTTAQREQFLAETPEQARAEYDGCTTRLAARINAE